MQLTFQELLEPIHAGEQELKDYLRANDLKVIDVSDNPQYFKKDIDLFVEQDGRKIGLEVKWDKCISYTGNMYIETLSDIEKRKDGWFNFCVADFLCYGDSVNQLYYIIALDDLHAYIDEHKEELKKRTAKDYGKNGEVTKLSLGYLVPIADFPKKTIIRL